MALSVSFIPQLVALLKERAPHVTEFLTDAELELHFYVQVKHDRVRALFNPDGTVRSFVDFSWLNSLDEIGLSYGDSGRILLVHNVVSGLPGDIWKLRAMLPHHHWIVWFHDFKLHAPRGLPV
jgi:hypothetical protein